MNINREHKSRTNKIVMLIKNRFLLSLLIVSGSKIFLKFYWQKILGSVFILLILIGGYRIYSYYNRLELIDRYMYHSDVFELYRDWSKSTNYYIKYSDRFGADNYYVIKKNGNMYFRYQHNYPFDVSYCAFYIESVEFDSLVLVQKGIGDEYGAVLLKVPLNKDIITKKDVRIIPIYPGILKDGSEREADDSTHYFLDDFKKVPMEVINYENIISDY